MNHNELCGVHKGGTCFFEEVHATNCERGLSHEWLKKFYGKNCEEIPVFEMTRRRNCGGEGRVDCPLKTAYKTTSPNYWDIGSSRDYIYGG